MVSFNEAGELDKFTKKTDTHKIIANHSLFLKLRFRIWVSFQINWEISNSIREWPWGGQPSTGNSASHFNALLGFPWEGLFPGPSSRFLLWVIDTPASKNGGPALFLGLFLRAFWEEKTQNKTKHSTWGEMLWQEQTWQVWGHCDFSGTEKKWEDPKKSKWYNWKAKWWMHTS